MPLASGYGVPRPPNGTVGDFAEKKEKKPRCGGIMTLERCLAMRANGTLSEKDYEFFMEMFAKMAAEGDK